MANAGAALLSSDTTAANKDIARQLFEIGKDYFFLSRVSELKLNEIATGLRLIPVGANPTVQLALTRSLVEHLGAYAFLVGKLRALVDGLNGQENQKRVDDLIIEACRVARKIYFGVSPVKKTSLSQFHVNDFIRSLGASWAKTYDDLTEFVHPNYGSNLLVSSGKLGGGRLSAPHGEVHADVADAAATACRCVVDALKAARELGMELGRLLIRIQNWIEIAVQPGRKPLSVFIKKNLDYDGDGTSMVSAVYFRKARTKMESIEMIYRYLEETGAIITGVKESIIEAGFVYDMFPTRGGRIWFKTPLI
jgi:hypothetical protein